MIPAQTPFVHGVMMLAYGLHIGGGTIGLVSGTIAAFARKGGHLHRLAGNVFFVSILVMATFAAWLAVAVPGQMVNLFGGIFVFYLTTTAWLTVRRAAGTIGVSEKIALAIVLCLCAPFAFLVYQAATGSAPQLKGPVLIATVSLAAIVAITAITDAKLVLAGGISGAPRIARHLWRMCLALLMATGSAFTNGLPRLLPGPMNMSPIFFLPMLLPLGLLIFWMIRVRLTHGFKNAALAV
jgi:hypothetical protein